ncbi:MAG: putative toxin-antitoxin system toxin component, PIN family [Kiritimatiellia bacterium]
MTRIVLDTNVLVSGMINAHGPPGRIVDLLREGLIELVVDDRVLSEYRMVLNRPKFKRYFDNQAVCDILNFLEHNTTYMVPVKTINGLPDPDDVPFAELALTAGVPLVTGNTADFPKSLLQNVRIFTPAEYIRERKDT